MILCAPNPAFVRFVWVREFFACTRFLTCCVRVLDYGSATMDQILRETMADMELQHIASSQAYQGMIQRQEVWSSFYSHCQNHLVAGLVPVSCVNLRVGTHGFGP